MNITIDKSVTWGNIVSWIVIVISVATGYAKLESATQQNAKDVAAAVVLAHRVEEAQRAMDVSRTSQIHALTVDVAKTNVTVISIEKKLDELIRRKE